MEEYISYEVVWTREIKHKPDQTSGSNHQFIGDTELWGHVSTVRVLSAKRTLQETTRQVTLGLQYISCNLKNLVNFFFP